MELLLYASILQLVLKYPIVLMVEHNTRNKSALNTPNLDLYPQLMYNKEQKVLLYE